MKKKFLMLSMLFAVFISCNNSRDVKEICDCYEQRTNFQVENLQGVVYFNDEVQKFYILVHTDGTYDNVIMYFPCKIDENYKNKEQVVIFSGKVFDFDGSINIPAGFKCYCIELTTINDL